MIDRSRRIQLIQEISLKCASISLNVVRMTLDQFSIPNRGFWGGSTHDYLIEMLPKANDSDLLDLAAHFGLTVAPASNSEKIWVPGYLRVFVSHLATFREEASELGEWLGQKTVSTFVAHNDIEPTEEWQKVILDALATADVMIVLLRPGFHSSIWTNQEIGHAIARGILVVPVRLGADPHGFIEKFQAVNGLDKPIHKISNEIVSILRKHRLTAKRMAEALVLRFENSKTFVGAKENASLLLEAGYWDASLTQRCRDAKNHNSQISNAYRVENIIESVIEKHESNFS